eukprot:jgi/Chrzof1/1308/Cz10g02150.t1
MASAHQDSETEATPAMPSQPMTFSSDHLVGTSQQQQSLQTELHRHPEEVVLQATVPSGTHQGEVSIDQLPADQPGPHHIEQPAQQHGHQPLLYLPHPQQLPGFTSAPWLFQPPVSQSQLPSAANPQTSTTQTAAKRESNGRTANLSNRTRLNVPLKFVKQHFSDAVFPVPVAVNLVVNGTQQLEVHKSMLLRHSKGPGRGEYKYIISQNIARMLSPYTGWDLTISNWELKAGNAIQLTVDVSMLTQPLASDPMTQAISTLPATLSAIISTLHTTCNGLQTLVKDLQAEVALYKAQAQAASSSQQSLVSEVAFMKAHLAQLAQKQQQQQQQQQQTQQQQQQLPAALPTAASALLQARINSKPCTAPEASRTAATLLPASMPLPSADSTLLQLPQLVHSSINHMLQLAATPPAPSSTADACHDAAQPETDSMTPHGVPHSSTHDTGGSQNQTAGSWAAGPQPLMSHPPDPASSHAGVDAMMHSSLLPAAGSSAPAERPAGPPHKQVATMHHAYSKCSNGLAET